MGVWGQSSTDSLKTFHLKEAVILPRLKEQFQSQRGVLQLANNQLNTAAEVLTYESPWFNKNYGPSQISSFSVRGASAAQSVVLWNGINIQSPMHGQSDLNLLLPFLSDGISLQSGSHTDIYGSGAIGGALKIEQKPAAAIQSGLWYEMGFGSFGFWRQSLSLQQQYKGWLFRIKSGATAARNNFFFNNYALHGQPRQQLQHAQTKLQAFTIDLEKNIGQFGHLAYSGWFQNSQRQIPGNMISPQSRAEQKDKSHKHLVQYRFNKQLHHIEIKIAYINEALGFVQESAKIRSQHQTQLFQHEAEYALKHRKHQFHGGYQGIFTQANSIDYTPHQPSQLRYAIFGGWLLKTGVKRPLSTRLALRQEWINQTTAPLTYSLDVEWTFWSRLSSGFRVSRIYRIPNLNDLFWRIGGNPNLKPEDGWSGEFSLLWNGKLNRLVRLKAYSAAWLHQINNWIVWLPDAGTWKPQNLRQVNSIGTEWWLAASLVKIPLHLKSGGAFVYVSNQIPSHQHDVSVGNQLIYQPYWRHYWSAQYQIKNFHINYRHQYTGFTYTSADHQSWLPGFHTAGIELKWKGQKKQWKNLTLSLMAENLFNADYQVIEWNAQPGRHGRISIQYQITKHKK